MNIYLELINCSFFKQTTNCKTGTVYKYVHRTKALTSLHTKAKINTCSIVEDVIARWHYIPSCECSRARFRFSFCHTSLVPPRAVQKIIITLPNIYNLHLINILQHKLKVANVCHPYYKNITLLSDFLTLNSLISPLGGASLFQTHLRGWGGGA